MSASRARQRPSRAVPCGQTAADWLRAMTCQSRPWGQAYTARKLIALVRHLRLSWTPPNSSLSLWNPFPSVLLSRTHTSAVPGQDVGTSVFPAGNITEGHLSERLGESQDLGLEWTVARAAGPVPSLELASHEAVIAPNVYALEPSLGCYLEGPQHGEELSVT